MTRVVDIATRAVALVVLVACRQGNTPQRADRYALGHAATTAEIAARDVDVGPDGIGLPPGKGSATDGEALFATQCASCHGARGEGQPPRYPALVGRDPRAANFEFGKDPNLKRTIGDYWPYATTVFDYVRRAMPQMAPGSLTNDDLYAITAYLLAANQVIPMTATLDATSLAAVKMPSALRFVRDDRRGAREVK